MGQHYDQKHAEILLSIYQDLDRYTPVRSHLNPTSTSGICLKHETTDDGSVYRASARQVGPVFIGFNDLACLEVGIGKCQGYSEMETNFFLDYGFKLTPTLFPHFDENWWREGAYYLQRDIRDIKDVILIHGSMLVLVLRLWHFKF